eukprot:TRINITY_DN6971_c0_g2_i2.p1 TRINITY_DN6971_c0_g2~~TRINITY_DN6971_c0_g2_i2.p1  ORF type:complete len:615 (+),score=306.89 TRINITY_DN6971_c0_g2_i2:80-1924(+)
MSLTSMVADEGEKTWKDFGLDPRILQAVKVMRYKNPSLIQESTIPLALAGKDILARAGTGSGKTAAYSIPICHKLLRLSATKAGAAYRGVKALILVPSKELCHQLLVHFREILSQAEGALQVLDVSETDPQDWSGQSCDICIGTPTTVMQHVKAKHLDISGLSCCVVDEADALLSHPTMRKLRSVCPTTTQSYLMSATLSPGVLELKRLLLNSPVVVKLEEEEEDEGVDAEAKQQVSSGAGSLPNITQQYVVYDDDAQRYCFLYSMMRFGMVDGKVLIFVDSVDRAYKLKLFLDKFSIRAVVLNADIPLNSRNHIVSQFNVGEYNYLIATDMVNKPQPVAKGKKAGKSEYGVSRGIDFREVAYVINFDSFAELSETACKSYIHRIGRTGRAGKKGTAITFVNRKEEFKHGWVDYLNMYLESKGQVIGPHKFCTDASDPTKLQYRTNDALLGIRKKAIREAKVKELVQEALASEALKQHFSENPNDLAALKHVTPLKRHDKLAAESNAYVPEYLAAPVTGKIDTETLGSRKRKHDEEDDDDADPDEAVPSKPQKGRRKDPLTALKVKSSGKPVAKPKKAGGKPKSGGDNAAEKPAQPAAKKRRVVKVVKKKKAQQ